MGYAPVQAVDWLENSFAKKGPGGPDRKQVERQPSPIWPCGTEGQQPAELY